MIMQSIMYTYTIHQGELNIYNTSRKLELCVNAYITHTCIKGRWGGGSYVFAMVVLVTNALHVNTRGCLST